MGKEKIHFVSNAEATVSRNDCVDFHPSIWVCPTRGGTASAYETSPNGQMAISLTLSLSLLFCLSLWCVLSRTGWTTQRTLGRRSNTTLRQTVAVFPLIPPFAFCLLLSCVFLFCLFFVCPSLSFVSMSLIEPDRLASSWFNPTFVYGNFPVYIWGGPLNPALWIDTHTHKWHTFDSFHDSDHVRVLQWWLPISPRWPATLD